MKPIAILSYDYPPSGGGISRLCSEVARQFVRLGREVSVLTTKCDDAQRAMRPHLSTQEVRQVKWLREWATFWYVLGLPAEVTVVSSLWNPEGTLTWLARRRNAVVMAHGNEVMPYPPLLRFAMKRWLRRRVLESAAAVICSSRYSEQLVRAASPRARTVVITPGVDACQFRPCENVEATRQRLGLPVSKRIVLSVSRIDAYKGHDVMLKALAALAPGQRDRLQYVVAGKGAYVETLKSLARSLGVGDHVTWFGFVDEAELPHLYACADLFVLCTKEDAQARGVEGFGMVFLEAQAAGIPVLGTRAGGIPDAIVEGQGGWLVEEDDVLAVRDHLGLLGQDIQQFRDQGKRGRARACRDGSWEAYASKLQAVLDQER